MQKRLISPELSGTAAPPLITQQTSREEICCLSDSLLFCSVFLVIFFLKAIRCGFGLVGVGGQTSEA